MEYYVEKDKTSFRHVSGFVGVRHVQGALIAGVLVANNIIMGNTGISITSILNQETGSKKMLSKESLDEQNTLFNMRFPLLIVSFLCGGYFCNKLNAKNILLIVLIIGAITNYVTPVLVNNFGWEAMAIIKIIQSSVQGLVRPLAYSQIVRWLPKDELMLLGPVILCGVYIGYAFITVMGVYLGTGDNGWPSIFYFCGNCTLLWALAYACLGSHSPNYCFYISDVERRFIESSMPFAVRRPYRTTYPVLEILKCVPFYALVLSHVGNNWAFQVFNTELPKYLLLRLGYNERQVGLIIGMPYLFFIATLLVINSVLMTLKKRGKLKESVLRHIGFGIGQFGAFYCFMINSFSKNYYLTFTLHCLGVILSSFQMYGFYMNYFDLAPNYVGFIVGISSGISVFSAMMGPRFTEMMVERYPIERTMEALQMMYFTIAMIYLISGIIWQMFGSTKIQPFNDITEKPEKKNLVYEDLAIKTS